MNQMKMWLLHVSVLIAAIVFVVLYVRLISPKHIIRGLEYGLLFGLAAGVSMGLGTYSFMPIPLYMAIVWLIGVYALVFGITMLETPSRMLRYGGYCFALFVGSAILLSWVMYLIAR